MGDEQNSFVSLKQAGDNILAGCPAAVASDENFFTSMDDQIGVGQKLFAAG